MEGLRQRVANSFLEALKCPQLNPEAVLLGLAASEQGAGIQVYASEWGLPASLQILCSGADSLGDAAPVSCVLNQVSSG